MLKEQYLEKLMSDNSLPGPTRDRLWELANGPLRNGFGLMEYGVNAFLVWSESPEGLDFWFHLYHTGW